MKRFPSLNLHAIAHQAMADYGFVPNFPPSVIREAHNFVDKIKNYKADPAIKDMRDLLWSSIDNEDSRDLDQLEYCQRAPNLEIHVMVAIADVDYYVEKGAPTDHHANANGTSVYTGVETFPMLPERLCTDLSSLCEGEDRRALVVDFFVLKDGNIRPGGIAPALVRNKAKLVYEPVGDWLEGQGVVPFKVADTHGLQAQIILQDEAAQRLHNFRMEQGALELETIEAKPIVHGETVVDLFVQKKNQARFLIENFMIATNRTMVAFLEKNGVAYIQRILREPEHWLRIVKVAEDLADTLPALPDAKALDEFLVRQRKRNSETFPDLSLTIVKLIGQAEYVMVEAGKNNLGHFGLAVYDYTHSTAPNRRYIDIIIQRIIKAILIQQNAPYNKRELSDIASWCTDRDHSSKKVERFMRKVAGAVLLSDKIGQVFDAIVTGASDKGTYVRLLHPPVEGRVMRGEKGFEVGQRVRVRLVSMVPEKGYIDFENVGH